MHKVVVDASVVLKWVPGRREEDISRARVLYDLMISDRLEVWAPSFLLIEVLNILIHKRKTPHQIVHSILKRLLQGPINYTELQIDTVGEIEKIVFENDVSSYDAVYLWLAQKNECKLVTYDSELLKIKSFTISVEDLLDDYYPTLQSEEYEKQAKSKVKWVSHKQVKRIIAN